MTIVGGGYVAAEFAHVFSALGTEVTQVERGPLLLRRQDEDIARTFTQLAARQWDVRLDTRATGVEQRQDGTITVSLSDGTELETDVLLMATGRVSQRRPPRAGAHLDQGRGRTVSSVDEHQRTSVDGVWALGDVQQPLPAQARGQPGGPHASGTTCCTPTTWSPATTGSSRARCSPPPRSPRVGLTAQDAREQGIAHRHGHPRLRRRSPTDGPWRARPASSS